MTLRPTSPALKTLIIQELISDSAFDDETTLATIPESISATALIIAQQSGIFSGECICRAFEEVFSGQIELKSALCDGAPFESGQTLARFEGNLRTLLSAERTLLNFLIHLCGVATLTSRFVEAIRPLPTQILATRKTLPGLRSLELAAVVHGGGKIHRRSLSDGILIKENHISTIDAANAIAKAQPFKSPLHGIEIEVQNLEMLEAVLNAQPDIIMLDNLSPSDVQLAIQRINGRALIEVSGGINLENVRRFAELGVDFISVGKITHSAPSCDLSLDICPK